ncbi:MAG: STAS domain-containing protein [Candidatus Sumerlaeaceae bacterium]
MKAFSYETRQISHEGHDGVCFVLRGYIDAHTVIEFEKAVENVIASGTNRVILEMSALSYVSSAGIGAMMALARKLSQDGGDLVLLSPTQKVYTILEGLGFTKIFKIANTQHEALQKLKLAAPTENQEQQ